MSAIRKNVTKATGLGISFYVPAKSMVELTNGISLKLEGMVGLLEFTVNGEKGVILLPEKTLKSLKETKGRASILVKTIQEYRKSIK